MVISYELGNQEEFNNLLNKLRKVGSSKFVMGEMVRIVKKFSKANFILKGSGKYPELSDKYKKRKERLKPSAPILVYNGTLRDSIIGKTQYTLDKVTDSGAIIGTGVPYAKLHDTGTKNMPIRKPLFLTDAMVASMIKTYDANIEKGLKDLWKSILKKLKKRY